MPRQGHFRVINQSPVSPKTGETKMEEQTCTKEENAVAKHLRFNTPAYTGRLDGTIVKCFIASDAVNCLLDSKWAKGKVNSDSDIVFTDRKSCVQFLNRFIQKDLFFRAGKEESRKAREKKKKKKELEEKENEKESVTDSKRSKKSKKKEENAREKEEKGEAKKEENKKTDKKEEKLKKFKLYMSGNQRFVDGNSIYVWRYDPIHPKTFFMGFLGMLLGFIAFCLFPLWPEWMKDGVYYASLLVFFVLVFMQKRNKPYRKDKA